MRSSPPFAVAVVAVLVSVLLLGGCARDAGEVVRSGPAAASQEAVGNQGQPVAVDLPAPLARCKNAPAGWGLREARQRGVPELARSISHWMHGFAPLQCQQQRVAGRPGVESSRKQSVRCPAAVTPPHPLW